MQKNKILLILNTIWQNLLQLAKEYGLAEKIQNIILKSGILEEIQKQIADFALVAVYQAEFAFNKIGKEKKETAFKMLCNFIRYPAVLKPFKPYIENILFDFISNEIEDAVLKLKEHLQECKLNNDSDLEMR